MTHSIHKPYEQLDPNRIIQAIENAGYPCSGGLIGLNSYENRVYQVGIVDSTPLIAKFYRPNRWSDEAILEEHQFSNELIECDIPVIAPLKNDQNQTLHHYQDFRFALFPRQGGHALEVDNLEQLEWMGRFIGRLHGVGSSKPFHYRSSLTVKTHGHEPYHFLIKNHFIPDYLKPSYCETIDALLKKIELAFHQLTQLSFIRLHGDCHLGNILWDGYSAHIVDLDDAVMGPAIQDIWMLLSGDREQIRSQLHAILNGYRQFSDFDLRELSLIESMRTLRIIQYSAWLAARWEDPAFPAAFPWFNTSHYWEDHLKDLKKQFYLLDETIYL